MRLIKQSDARSKRPYTLLRYAPYVVVFLILALIINGLLSSLTPPVVSVANYIKGIPGLIAYYPLVDQPTDTTLSDAGPHHLNGTCSDVLVHQPGAVGSSYSFDGVKSYCSVPDNRLLSPTGGFTVVALVNLRDLNNLYALFDKSAFNLNGFRVYTNASKQILFDVVTASGEQSLASRRSFPGVNRWVFLAVTYNRYNQIIYVNGQEVQAHIGNSALDMLSHASDKFSDVNGMRAYPWGFEPQLGHTTNVFNGDGTISIRSSGDNNATFFALPDLTHDKPIVFAGKRYTESFDVKYNITSGHGVRVIHQWFNTTVPGSFPFQSDYSDFLTGSSDWTTLSLTKTAPAGAIRGDVVLEMWGTGTIEAKNPQFYLTDAADAAVTTNTQPLLIGQMTNNVWRMNGSLQHVAYFDRALSRSEVLSLAQLFAPYTK